MTHRSDYVLAGTLVAAPWWRDVLDLLPFVNGLLTTATLLIGLILGVARIYAVLHERDDQGG